MGQEPSKSIPGQHSNINAQPKKELDSGVLTVNQRKVEEEISPFIERLHNLPKVEPLIKHKENTLLGKLSRLSVQGEKTAQDLDCIDEKAIQSMFASWQTYALQRNRVISVKQKGIMEEMINLPDLRADLKKRAETYKRVQTALRDVDRVSRYIDSCEENLNDLFKQIHNLQVLLPENLDPKIRNHELFKWKDIQKKKSITSTRIVSDSKT